MHLFCAHNTQTILEKLESEVIEANQSVVKLKQNWMELTEMRYMLHIAHSFFDDVSFASRVANGLCAIINTQPI